MAWLGIRTNGTMFAYEFGAPGLTSNKKLLVTRASLLGTSAPLLGAWTLLGAPGLTRSKDASNGAALLLEAVEPKSSRLQERLRAQRFCEVR